MVRARPTIGIMSAQVIILIVLLAPSAQAEPHGPCTSHSGTKRDGISFSPNKTISAARGANGAAEVFDAALRYNGGKVQALYIIFDASWIVEFGWSQDRNGNIYQDKVVFEARQYGTGTGSYASSNIEEIDSGTHSFRLSRFADTKYHFALDGVFYPNNVTRDPPFVGGHPTAVSEVINQCDDAFIHWWNLDYKNKNEVWGPWTKTTRTCDLLNSFKKRIISDRDVYVVQDAGDWTGGECGSFY